MARVFRDKKDINRQTLGLLLFSVEISCPTPPQNKEKACL